MTKPALSVIIIYEVKNMSDQSKYYTVVKDYEGKEIANVHTGMLAKSLTLDNMAGLLQD